MIFTSCILAFLACADLKVDHEVEQPQWLKSNIVADKKAELQMASRRYSPPDGRTGDIWLVGVSHIGTAEFYSDIESLVSECDLVLYESVMEEAALGPRGETAEEKRTSTTAAMEWLADLTMMTDLQSGTNASSIDEVQARVVTIDRRLVDAVRSVRTDAWGHPLGFARNDNRTVITSLGADGLPGGEADAEDLMIEVPLPEEGDAPEGIQQALATALKLEFQLAVLPYEREDWVVSDMSWEMLQTRFEEEGVDLEGLSGMLSGSSLPAGIVKMLLRMLPALDVLTGGAVTDGVKVMMIELLGREDAMELALREVGGAGGRILIEDRNAVVIDDLQKVLEDGQHDCIAVLYGAGHMEDLGHRVEEMGWREAEVRWLPGISVDLENSRLSKMHMSMIRTSINSALEKMKHSN